MGNVQLFSTFTVSDRIGGIKLYDQKEDQKKLHSPDDAHILKSDCERRIFKDAQTYTERKPGRGFLCFKNSF